MLRVAVGQLCSSANLRHNASTVNKLIARAIDARAEVLFLPEATDYLAKDAATLVRLAATTQTDFLNVIASELKRVQSSLYVAVGIHLPSNDGQKVRNCQVLLDPHGKVIYEYQKIHLFDVDVPNGPILRESNSVEAGPSTIQPPISIFNPFKIGFATCYDIRFPEQAIKLLQLGANIITFPSAFTVKTGEAHWELLARARAIDTQSYVVMAAQCGEHDVGITDPSKKRISYGESIVVSPWGEVLLRLEKHSDELKKDVDGDYYSLGLADLDISKVETVRKNMPLEDHRKTANI